VLFSINHSIRVALYPVYTIKQSSSWLVQLTRISSSSQLYRVNGVLVTELLQA